MSRNILLFLVSFFVTLGVCVGIFILLKQNAENPAAKAAKEQIMAPAEPAPKPAPAPKPVTDKAETTTPAPAPKPVEPVQQVPVVKEAPAADPAPKAEEKMDNELKPAVKPRSAEHEAALIAAAGMAAENPKEALTKLAEQGKMSQSTADALAAWAAQHKIAKVEEVGNTRLPNGDRVTRYRMVSEGGKEDMLVDVTTKRDGSVSITAVQITTADKTDISKAPDSMTVAEGFVEAVRRGDMATARNMVTGVDVSDATVAGLCMIFEEGEFALREQTPIRNTFENDKNSGYIIYVVGKHDNKPANVGMELTKTDAGAWRVKAVAMDALLSSYENVATAEGGRYFPIVKNPKGGDSLALFFAFNESALTPRSLRQLQIVAVLLKASKGQLNISGHTDDVGSEKYNLALSERRAAAVKEALVSFGVDASQITTHGLGKSQPRRTYTTDDSEQQIDYIRGENRRAEIYLDFES